MSWAGIAVALLLPWACGTAWVAYLLRKSGEQPPHNFVLSIGYGFFIGLLGTTVLLRAWDALSGSVSFGAVSAILGALTLAAAMCLWRSPVPAHANINNSTSNDSSGWQLVGIALLLVWIGIRYGTMTQELLLRPLFAWDAWMNWAPKAITWYHLGTLAPWVEPWQWYGHADGYSTGNWISSGYPEGVPLVQLWFMLGAGTWDHGAVYIAWLLAPLALGAALYGHLRLAHMAALPAVLIVYLLLNMPFFNVHTVLAGYADSWLAAVFGLAVIALRQWRLSRQGSWLLLWLAMAILCAMLKNPGIILCAILVIAGLREAMRMPRWIEAAVVGVAAAVAALLVISSATVPIPLLGEVGWTEGELALGRIGRFAIEYHPVAGAFAESFFQSTNWNLLFYFMLPLLMWLLWRHRGSVLNPPAEVVALLGACAFVGFSFFFTNRFGGALNFSTVNRALLYLAPPLLFCLAVGVTQARVQASAPDTKPGS